VEELGLRPLVFGAAWKILDILVEHAMSHAGMNPHGKRLAIESKVKAMATGSISIEPIASDAEIWNRTCAAYVRTEQYRHSIVHRRVSIQTDGSFAGVDRAGNTLQALSALEQTAFCKAVQRIAASVISGALTPRGIQALGADLDKLSRLTGIPAGGYIEAQHPIPRFIIPVSAEPEIDMTSVKQKVATMVPGRSSIDVVFQVSDHPGLQFFCHLEEAPDIKLIINPATELPWLIRA
jgi:hypothetical protein